jgi:hypothetical protein
VSLLIAQMIVGHGRLWLTGQSGAPPDSLVNFSRGAFFISRERRVRHRATTGQFGAPQAGAGLADYSHFFSNHFPLFLAMPLALS